MEESVSLLVGYHYFSPDTKSEDIVYLHETGDKLQIGRYQVVLVSDFTVAGVNWADRSLNYRLHSYSREKLRHLYGRTQLKPIQLIIISQQLVKLTVFICLMLFQEHSGFTVTVGVAVSHQLEANVGLLERGLSLINWNMIFAAFCLNKTLSAIITKHLPTNKLRYRKYPACFPIYVTEYPQQNSAYLQTFNKSGMVQYCEIFWQLKMKQRCFSNKTD